MRFTICSGVAAAGLEALREPVEHHEPLGVHGRDRHEPAVAHERAQHPRDVLGLVVVLVGSRRALGLGARRERERLAEQVQRAVVAADDEAGVDEALQRPAGRARVEAGVARAPRRSSVAPSTSAANTRRRSSSASRPTSSAGGERRCPSRR